MTLPLLPSGAMTRCSHQSSKWSSDVKGVFAFVGFLLCLPAANWLIGNVGTFCVPQGPCLVPVGFGFSAPSGVLVIGVALVLRDSVHHRLGAIWAFAAIAAGGALSFAMAVPALAVASTVAFLLSELADLAVYAPLRRRHMPLAVVASGLVGAAFDSAAFLWLAFGSLDLIEGQVLGKLYASGAVAIVLWARGQK